MCVFVLTFVTQGRVPQPFSKNARTVLQQMVVNHVLFPNVCVCVCVCVYACMHACVYVCVCVRVHVCMCVSASPTSKSVVFIWSDLCLPPSLDLSCLSSLPRSGRVSPLPPFLLPLSLSLLSVSITIALQLTLTRFIHE
jgi:hypothetical protein